MEDIKFFIAHNNDDIVNFGKVAKASVVSTGQPHLEEFENEEEFSARLNELKKDSEFYAKYLEEQKEEDPEEKERKMYEAIEEEIKQKDLETEQLIKEEHNVNRKIKTPHKRL
jgi:hypothetical protein